MPRNSRLTGVSDTPLVSSLGVTSRHLRSPAVGGSGRALAGSSVTRSTNAPATFTPGGATGGGNTGDASYRYVNPARSTNGNGMSWSTAFNAIPATLTRGLTYYLADGAYPSRNFNTAASGTTLITIKKATVADHGEDISGGWSDTLGDGQAIFGGQIAITTSHWVLDGQVRNEADWFADTAYGIKADLVTSNNQSNEGVKIADQGGPGVTNITVRYVCAHLPGPPVSNGGANTRTGYCFSSQIFENFTSSNILCHRCYAKGGSNSFFMRTATGFVVEYSAASDVCSNEDNHGNVFNNYFGTSGNTVRFCRVRDAFTSTAFDYGFGTNIMAMSDAAANNAFYGNVVWRFGSTDAAVGFNSATRGSGVNCRIYNNTFVGGVGYNSGVILNAGSGNIVQNNLWVNCTVPSIDIGTGGTASYNAWSNSSGYGTNAQLNVPTSIFVSYTGGDFRLASATSAGLALAAPYNTDMLGNTRGGDGVWDRGAFEKV